ncbi:MAG: N-acyl-phosphatidylethanolamine-hydrolyzing phospholipase [Chlamydiota bacterium]
MTRYVNPHAPHSRRSFWEVVKWKFGAKKGQESDSASIPDGFSYPAVSGPATEDKPTATWIGHSTYFIQVDGLNILTDPIWDAYCAPIPIPGLRRKIAPARSLSELPPIDFVLLSHNHYDHLDAKTVQYLKRFHPQIHWIVPTGLSSWFARRGIKQVTELSWWKSVNFARCAVTAVPAQHFSGRTIWDQNATHWNGYVLETANKKLYFVGDTGYNRHDFQAIGDKWRGFDLSLIPIGAYAPRWFMHPVHVSPFEAVLIHRDVKSTLSLGMHWKTFHLSDEPLHRPPYDLYLAMQEINLPFATFLPVEPGVIVNW